MLILYVVKFILFTLWRFAVAVVPLKTHSKNSEKEIQTISVQFRSVHTKVSQDDPTTCDQQRQPYYRQPLIVTGR